MNKQAAKVSRTLFFVIAAALATKAAYGYGYAFLKYEQPTGNGTMKQCVYDYMGSPYVITVERYQVCQPSIVIR